MKQRPYFSSFKLTLYTSQNILQVLCKTDHPLFDVYQRDELN